MIHSNVFAPRAFRFLGILSAFLVLFAPFLIAQDPDFDFKPGGKTLAQQGLFGNLGGEAKVSATAEFSLVRGTNKGRLAVTLVVPEGHHIYSLTQPKGGPIRTTIAIDPASSVKLTTQFQANRDPRVHEVKFFKVPVEEYDETIVCQADFELLDDADPDTTTIDLSIDGQLCKGTESCTNFELQTKATFSGFVDPPVTEFQPEGAQVKLTGEADFSGLSAGGKVIVRLTATPIIDADGHWHIYDYAPVSFAKVGEGSPTLIVWTKGAWQVSLPTESTQAVLGKGFDGSVIRYYEGPVTWTYELTPPPGGLENAALPKGMIGLQTCTDQRCLGQTVTEFTVPITADANSIVPLEFAAGTISYKELNKLAAQAVPQKQPVDWGQLGLILIFAFVGGAILNLMPCVLPVIGLKVLSFARQGGQSHARVFGLNLAYSIGLISVFMVLAGLAAFLNLGWGDQFQIIEFKITMTAVVFVMALSFLGVWELPVPGFATTGKAGELQNQHGLIGAFFKGQFTTLLATPCSGPFLGAVFPFALKQEPAIIFLIFGCIGFGMASPYLVIGIFPGMVKFLPKPGEWMETFERVMGFVLLGTVVYLFSTFGKENQHLFIPTFALLVALWFGCWLIGQVPEYAGLGKKAMSWLAAGAVAGVVGYGAFVATGHNYLKWEPYDEAKLAQYLREGRTVMVDFTADWCLTCQVNKAVAIDTRRISELAQQNGVIAMLADKTNPAPDIERKLAELNSNSIPLLAIFPGSRPNEPIVLRDLLVEGQVVTALEKAGPSREQAEKMTTAIRPVSPAMP